MIEISRRDFEICCYNNKNVIIVCITPFSNKCDECIKEIEESDIRKIFPYYKFYKYNIITDIEKMEKYNIVNTPTILFFKSEKMVESFPFNDVEDLIKRLNLHKENSYE